MHHFWHMMMIWAYGGNLAKAVLSCAEVPLRSILLHKVSNLRASNAFAITQNRESLHQVFQS